MMPDKNTVRSHPSLSEPRRLLRCCCTRQLNQLSTQTGRLTRAAVSAKPLKQPGAEPLNCSGSWYGVLTPIGGGGGGVGEATFGAELVVEEGLASPIIADSAPRKLPEDSPSIMSALVIFKQPFQ